MTINRKKTVTKTIAIILAICAVYGIVFNIVQAFTLFGIIMAIANLALSVVCFKEFGKDKKICIGIFGFLIIFEIVNCFFLTSISILSIVFVLIRIIGYLTIILYIIGAVSKKIIPIFGGLAVSASFIYNTFGVVLTFKNLYNSFGQFQISSVLIIKSVIACIATALYAVPTFCMVILIACGAIITTKHNRD